MWPELDIPIEVAWWLLWMTLALVGLIVLSLLALRWRRWRHAPQQAAFEARWQPWLMRGVAGEDVLAQLPRPARHERWPLFKLWLHCQMSVQGPCRDRLARLGLALGCREIALQQVRSSHQAERLIGLLALGFLRDAASVPLLTQQLAQGSQHALVHAGRALLEVDAPAHADAVVQALLAREGLNLSLVSVLFKPWRQVLGPAMQAQALSLDPAQGQQALRCLRLARALQLQWPLQVLQPFLGQSGDAETLIAAIRLVQGEAGAAPVAAHAGHPDWQVRAQVARALGYIGGLPEVPLLAALVTDTQWWVRYRSAQALLRVPGLARGQAQALVSATGDRYAMGMLDAVMAERAA